MISYILEPMRAVGIKCIVMTMYWYKRRSSSYSWYNWHAQQLHDDDHHHHAHGHDIELACPALACPGVQLVERDRLRGANCCNRQQCNSSVSRQCKWYCNQLLHSPEILKLLHCIDMLSIIPNLPFQNIIKQSLDEQNGAISENKSNSISARFLFWPNALIFERS